jgi:hypothetical protein
MTRRKVLHHFRWFVVLAAVTLLAAAGGVTGTGSAGTANAAPAAPDAQFFDLLNQYRTSKGLAPLARDTGLDGVAQQWSGAMAGVFAANGGVVVDPAAPKDCARSALCHRPDLAHAVTGVEPAWTGAAENIAVGGDVVGIHNSLVADPPHEANMVGTYNRVGVGVTVVGDRIWVVFDFLAGPPLAAAPAPAAGAVRTNAPAPPPVAVTPASPQRLLDTRDGTGGHPGPLAGGSQLTLPVAGVGQVPSTAVGLIVNITATDSAVDGYLTVYPCGTTIPTASSVNYRAGITVPNLVIVALGGGSLCIFSNATTDVIADIAGWYTPDSGTTFSVSAPTRVLDSRNGALGQSFTIPLGASLGAEAVAATFNLTVTDPTGPGYVTAYPCGTAPPLVSNVNFDAGQIAPNRATVPIGANRSICFYSSVPTHLIVDLVGAYGGKGSAVTLVVPQRLVDTRNGTGGWSGVLASGQSIDVPIGGAAAIPAGAVSVAFNVTVTNDDQPGFVTAYACSARVPLASNLNYVAGETRANLVTVPIQADGKVCFYTNGHAAIVADIAGYVS